MLTSGSDRCFTGRLAFEASYATRHPLMGALSPTFTPLSADKLLVFFRATEGREDETRAEALCFH